mmetsp:Transcript_31152/g.60709  ORF Transcript_31152/g.60709 Transcript_31152/m.60709 type:complete len:114 (+) Transcript_31152:41-382(+)|eukprot:CAMPEP_0175137174 /NCGR_PEP_ID=MMETSP0087-20121206/9673_1 /TAXON_ID=136419 /ORGANISM="Unknown Unknown, Strain D1" /LENGTH=113 /DNA_ID=CAMNT_0016419989 /DNA_START=44 /DNA_END=385 /DNA_ORIENTATION=-
MFKIALLVVALVASTGAVSFNKNVAIKNGQRTLNCASFKMKCPNQDELDELLGTAAGQTKTFYIGCCGNMPTDAPPEKDLPPVEPQYFGEYTQPSATICPGCKCEGDCSKKQE